MSLWKWKMSPATFSKVFMVTGIVNIAVSFFNEENWIPILLLGVGSLVFGIIGYLKVTGGRSR
jgi:uncharacterized membrane protein HdeD (DUF308 family)